MYDGGKIVTGLVIFGAVVLLPVWHNAVARPGPAPKPKIVTTEKHCVAPTAYMRSSHMELLNRWRDTVVRQGERTYVNDQGRKVTMSLTNGCMECHTNKAEFCDSCHNYLAVAPYCWECHVEPKERA